LDKEFAMRYAVVIEKAAKNYSGYAPDVPGCGVTGKTVQETLTNLRTALQMHFEGLQEDGEPIPDPISLCDYDDVEIIASMEVGPRGSR
jgi:predicted RNase H-like HicB family nuclease